MSDCCGGGDAGRPPCPHCGEAARTVPRRTLLHRLRWPLNRALPPQEYFYCANPACDLCYFGGAGTRFMRGDLRPAGTETGLLCYCFGITAPEADAAAREFVTAQTREGVCACEVRNPAGRCCLAAFPQPDNGGGDNG